MKKYFVLLMITAVMIVAGCSEEDVVTKGKDKVIIPVTGITIEKSATEIMVPRKELLYVDITPSNASNKKVIWTSSASNVASVDPWGEVTALSEGTAIMTVTTEDGGFTASCVVTVISNIAISVTGVTMEVRELAIATAQKFALSASVTPADADIQTVAWSSSNPDVALINADGVVEGLKAGTATITVTTEDGGFTATCAVTVTEDFLIEDFESYPVGTVLPSAGWNDSPAGRTEIALAPKDDPDGPVGLGLVGPGKVLLIYGDVVNATYGNIGSNRVAPKFEVKLPDGKVLGDYKSLIFDAYVYRGKDTGPQDNLGDAESGCGWFGAGVHIRINDVQGGSTNLRTRGEVAYVGPDGEVKGDGSNWPAKTWARGIKIDLSELAAADFDTVKSLNSFTLVFGTESGYAVYCMDNVMLKK